jgi:hypothetical protein
MAPGWLKIWNPLSHAELSQARDALRFVQNPLGAIIAENIVPWTAYYSLKTILGPALSKRYALHSALAEPSSVHGLHAFAARVLHRLSRLFAFTAFR